MINVLERKPIPRGQVRCKNCDSLLEYGNEDLIVERYKNSIFSTTTSTIECPVCRCITYAPILKPEKGGEA